SSLFEEHDKILEAVSRPDEVEEEDCEVSCTNYTIKVADLISGRTQDRVREELFEESEGDDIVFMCPKAPVDMPVAWINESRVLVGPWLKDETGDRVSIDEHNSLHIKPLQPWDAGHYACIYGGRIRGRLRLEVKMKRPPSRVLLYAYYLLLTYPADLLVFLVLLCVRRKERSKVLNFDLLPEFEGSEESDEENDEKSDESEEDEKSDGSEEDESLESDES
ncbi:Ig-like V-type domain-containing protein, partial [Biomphalaria glabrata]